MFLDEIASEHINEPMEAWNEGDNTFSPGAFQGRIGPTDRFLSNFNKPLRRRMLFLRADEPLPDSNVFRHPGTGDVYIVGQRRGDTLKGAHYLDLRVCHLVTDEGTGSSGLATLTRKAPAGPSNDPGWLVETELGVTYVDLEFRTSANEPDMHEVKVENYYAFAPIQWQLKPWDFIELHGVKYRVVDTFNDSGFAGLRVDEESDTRVDFVCHLQGARAYDNVTHQWTDNATSYNVTGRVAKSHDFSHWLSESEPYMDVVIEADHIGFVPKPDTLELEYQGKRRRVSQVDTSPNAEQYRLRCR